MMTLQLSVVNVLLMLMLLSQRSLAQDEQEMSGSGEGSGNYDGSCRRPLMPTMYTMKEDNVKTEIRCHLTCIDKVNELSLT